MSLQRKTILGSIGLLFLMALMGCGPSGSTPSGQGLWRELDFPPGAAMGRDVDTAKIRQELIAPLLAEAATEDRWVLLYFTGSDWCPPCKRMDSEVFQSAEFRGYASVSLLPVKVDFPRKIKQEDSRKMANMALAESFGVRGFPTVVVLNRDGSEAGRTGFRPGGATGFIGSVEAMTRR